MSKDSPKIAFVSVLKNMPWAGSEELWSRTAFHLFRRGHRVCVHFPYRRNIPCEIADLQHEGCEIACTPGGQWLDRTRPDLVVVSQGANFDGLDYAKWCLDRKIPYALIAHMAFSCHWPRNEKERQRYADMYEKAVRAYFVSKQNIEMTRTLFFSPIVHARQVMNPVKVACEEPLAWPISDPVFKLACVARLDMWQKGQDMLLEVMRMKKWQDRPVEVTLFGAGHHYHTLLELRKMWGIRNVFLAGHSPDLEWIWRAHHALVLPSRFEGMPMAVVEAMWCGRPCIVTKVGRNPETIEDNENGFLAKAPTTKWLDEAMERAWERRHEWREMGLRAAQKIREIVPRDPVREFAEDLRGLCGKGGRAGAPSLNQPEPQTSEALR